MFHFFTWNQSYQRLKSAKPQHFHEFFSQFFSTNFLVKKTATPNIFTNNFQFPCFSHLWLHEKIRTIWRINKRNFLWIKMSNYSTWFIFQKFILNYSSTYHSFFRSCLTLYFMRSRAAKASSLESWPPTSSWMIRCKYSEVRLRKALLNGGPILWGYVTLVSTTHVWIS